MDTLVVSISWIFIVNNVAMNTGFIYLFKLVFSFSQGICPVVGLLGLMVVLFLVS